MAKLNSCLACFEDRGQESDPATMDFAVTIEDHGVHYRAASLISENWPENKY